jgi:hypothetical protein
MKQLTINLARTLGKDMDAKGIVILAFGDDGEFQACSYGRTKQDCGQLGKWLDRIYDAVESGKISAPFAEQPNAKRLTGTPCEALVNSCGEDEARAPDLLREARLQIDRSAIDVRTLMDRETSEPRRLALRAAIAALYEAEAELRGLAEYSSKLAPIESLRGAQ